MESEDHFEECRRNYTALTVHATLFPYVPDMTSPSRHPGYSSSTLRQSLFSGWFPFDSFGYDFRRCFALNDEGRSQRRHTGPPQEGVVELCELNLEAFPDEVLFVILDSLPTLFELMRCTRVSRRWGRLIQEKCLPRRQEFSRRVLLPALANGQRDPWKCAAECIHPLLFYARPFIPKGMLKTLLKKVAPNLTHLSFDMLRNECSECLWCSETTKYTIAHLPRPANDLQRTTEWIERIELEAESHCKVEGSMSGVLLDEETVGILATSAIRLRHLNLCGVRFTTPACELSLCQGLADRIETLVLGESGGWSAYTRVEINDFIAAFTRLQRLTILLPSCIIPSKSILDALPLPRRLPRTLVELRLLACCVDIDTRLADLLAGQCPKLRTLAIRVAATVDYNCLNRVCAKLENLELHFYKFAADVFPKEAAALRFISQTGHDEQVPKFDAPSLISLKVLSSECVVPPSDVTLISDFLQVICDGMVLSCESLIDLQINLMSQQQLQYTDNPTTLRDGSAHRSARPWLWPIGEQLARLTSLQRAELWGASVNGEALERLASEGKLQELSLRCCDGEKMTRGILAVTTKCQSLRRLTIAQCSCIESSVIFASLCECLDGDDGCDGWTVDEIQRRTENHTTR